MTDPAYFDGSYPPEILRGYEPSVEPPVTELTRRTAAGPLEVTAGQPGTYSADLEPDERPRTLDELRTLTRPATTAPWAAGEHVLYGNGKRAHWTGEDWHSGDSPGYPDEPDEPDDDEEPDQ